MPSMSAITLPGRHPWAFVRRVFLTASTRADEAVDAITTGLG